MMRKTLLYTLYAHLFMKLCIAISFIFLTGLYLQVEGGEPMDFVLKSAVFQDGDAIPQDYTCEGMDVSVPLAWEKQPEGVKSYTLLVEDPDAPVGTFTHWILYDLPGDITELVQGIPSDQVMSNGSMQGKSDFGRIGYGGPCPPRGHGRHRYFFILRALDVKSLGLKPGAAKREVEKAMEGHVLGEARLMGIYERK